MREFVSECFLIIIASQIGPEVVYELNVRRTGYTYRGRWLACKEDHSVNQADRIKLFAGKPAPTDDRDLQAQCASCGSWLAWVVLLLRSVRQTGSKRQIDAEGIDALLAADKYGAAVHQGDGLDDGQAQAVIGAAVAA